jgi:hypothetical protein
VVERVKARSSAAVSLCGGDVVKDSNGDFLERRFGWSLDHVHAFWEMEQGQTYKGGEDMASKVSASTAAL